MRCPLPLLFILALLFLIPDAGLGANSKAIVLEDFDDGQVTLWSYADQDQEPDAWEVTDENTYDSSAYSLLLHGNTWKLEEIDPCTLVAGQVWQVAAYIAKQGEIQGFGLADSAHVLLYALAGSELLDPQEWVTVYQGAFSEKEWHIYALPVAQDWVDWHGYLPAITGLVYVNDRDASSEGVIYFDEIIDVTEDLPIAPQVQIQHTLGKSGRNENGTLTVTVQFHALAYDPDSDTLFYYWDFGDDSTSQLQNPAHDFVVMDDHLYTVRLEVLDPDGLRGGDTSRIVVDPGPTSFPVTMNFVGDVMLARRYEEPGGIIPTYGVEYIFESTREVYGEAAAVSVCNLECPLTDEGEPHPTKEFVFRGKPSNVAGLDYAGIDVVALGNNHIVDYGARGLEETQEVLDSTGILHSGAGANSYFALLPVFLSKNGVNIAFLSLCNRTAQYDNFQPFLNAGYNKPGFADLTEHNLQRCILSAREMADVVVVQLHSGIEYATDPGVKIDGLDPWDPEVIRFPTEPSMTDRELRWHAIDQGADVVICHHPHVLQGFEVYQGKLIAHSLGNFAFDQTFPETFPSVIVNSSIAEEGFTSFSLTPIYIDDLIPRPAMGELGLHILDRLADYSRRLGTLLRVVPDSTVAHVVLDTTSVETQLSPGIASSPMEEVDGQWISEPVQVPGNGSLSSITSLIGGSAWEVRVGRDVLWFGNFEDEGASMWNLNSSDEWLEDSLSHSGQRSLCLRRYDTSGDNVVTNLEGRLPCDPDNAYTICGWIKTEDANDATFQIRFYRYRYSGELLSQEDVGTQVDGDTDWTFYHRQVEIPSQASYYDFRSSSDSSVIDVSYAWFDDLRVIQWEDWQTATLPLSVPYPNDIRFLQVRSASYTENVLIAYEETGLVGIGVHVEENEKAGVPSSFSLLQNYPNPFNLATAIPYRIQRTDDVKLEVFNVLGQLVETVVDERQHPGLHRALWKATGCSSGIYFCRLQVGNHVVARKIMVIK